eukprot:424577_1
MADNLATIINFRRIVEALEQNQFMDLLSSICNECGINFLREIIFNGLQYTNGQTVDSNLQIIMKLTTNIFESHIPSSSSKSNSKYNQYNIQNHSDLKLNDLSEIDISNICCFLDFDSLLQFELTDRYIFIQAHKSISCISILNKPDWFNKYLLFNCSKYNKTKHINLSRFNHLKYLSFILDDNHKGSIMHKAKDIARQNNWSYSVKEFKHYCNYIAYALSKLTKINPIYFKCTLHFDWGIRNIRTHFPFISTWINSVKHIHFFNMKWNHILRFLELQYININSSYNLNKRILNAITFENIFWENSYLNNPIQYFNYFLDLIFNGYNILINNNKNKKQNEDIINENDNIFDKCQYAKLYGYRLRPELNGKLVQILHFSYPQQKWKIKLVSPKIGYNGPINEYMSVEQSHLKPILPETFDNINTNTLHMNGIKQLVFINMSLQTMKNDDNMNNIRTQMLDIFDDITIINKYLYPSIKYLIFHCNGNDELFYHLIQTILTIRSHKLESLHLQ